MGSQAEEELRAREGRAGRAQMEPDVAHVMWASLAWAQQGQDVPQRWKVLVRSGRGQPPGACGTPREPMRQRDQGLPESTPIPASASVCKTGVPTPRAWGAPGTQEGLAVGSPPRPPPGFGPTALWAQRKLQELPGAGGGWQGREGWPAAAGTGSPAPVQPHGSICKQGRRRLSPGNKWRKDNSCTPGGTPASVKDHPRGRGDPRK